MTDGNDTNGDQRTLDGADDRAGVPNATRFDDDFLDDDWDDLPPGTIYGECYGDPPPDWDESDDMDLPPTADDAGAEDCECEGHSSRLSWDSERECPFRTDAGEWDGYWD